MVEKFILINEEFSEKILSEIAELKRLVLDNNSGNKRHTDDELMDTAALMQYLNVDRRTIYSYRKKGLRCVRKDKGRLFFWKSDVDKFFGKEI